MSDSIETVDDYLAALPSKQRAVLGELRPVIKSAAPEADEVVSYRIPLYKHRGDLVGFGAFKNHCCQSRRKERSPPSPAPPAR